MANYKVIEHENEIPQFPYYWYDQHNSQEIFNNNFNVYCHSMPNYQNSLSNFESADFENQNNYFGDMPAIVDGQFDYNAPIDLQNERNINESTSWNYSMNHNQDLSIPNYHNSSDGIYFENLNYPNNMNYNAKAHHDPILTDAGIGIYNGGGAIDNNLAPMVCSIPYQSFDGRIRNVPTTTFTVPQEATTAEDYYSNTLNFQMNNYQNRFYEQAQIPSNPIINQVSQPLGFENSLAENSGFSPLIDNYSSNFFNSVEYKVLNEKKNNLITQKKSFNYIEHKASNEINEKFNKNKTLCLDKSCKNTNSRKRKSAENIENIVQSKCKYMREINKQDTAKDTNKKDRKLEFIENKSSKSFIEIKENKHGKDLSKLNKVKIVEICSLSDGFINVLKSWPKMSESTVELRKTLLTVIENLKHKTAYLQKFNKNKTSAKSLFIDYFIQLMLVPRYLPNVLFQYNILQLVFNILNNSLLRHDCLIFSYYPCFRADLKSNVINLISQFMKVLLKNVSKYCIMLTVIGKSKVIDEKVFKLFVFSHKSENMSLFNNNLSIDLEKIKSAVNEKYFPKLEKIETELYFAWIEEVLGEYRNLNCLKNKFLCNKEYVEKLFVLCNVGFSKEFLVQVQKLLINYQILVAKNLLKYYHTKLDFKESEIINVRDEKAVLWAIDQLNVSLFNEKLKILKKDYNC